MPLRHSAPGISQIVRLAILQGCFSPVPFDLCFAPRGSELQLVLPGIPAEAKRGGEVGAFVWADEHGTHLNVHLMLPDVAVQRSTTLQRLPVSSGPAGKVPFDAHEVLRWLRNTQDATGTGVARGDSAANSTHVASAEPWQQQMQDLKVRSHCFAASYSYRAGLHQIMRISALSPLHLRCTAAASLPCLQSRGKHGCSLHEVAFILTFHSLAALCQQRNLKRKLRSLHRTENPDEDLQRRPCSTL